MDSARSHLKDYIWADCNELGDLFFLLLATVPPFLLPFTISFRPPPCFLPRKKGNFELLFDDDASPTPCSVALFYRRLLADPDIDWDSRNLPKRTIPLESLKRNLFEAGWPPAWYSNNAPSGSSAIVDLFEPNAILSGIETKSSLSGKQWSLSYI